MPKLIEYPRTSYTGAWELAEIVDDTGGKCAIETAAKKLNRKVSGSFKAIIGSAVKFGLITSKRDLLTSTTLFKRIKHAYDKAEELQFHREAFLTPPLFTQLCRKFRNRELPVQMLDVMLTREFNVEEINAQTVAKAFVDGCRMCGLLNERNIVADIDGFSNVRIPRREISNAAINLSDTRQVEEKLDLGSNPNNNIAQSNETVIGLFEQNMDSYIRSTNKSTTEPNQETDTVANLFNLSNTVKNTIDSFQSLPSKPTTKSNEYQNVLEKALDIALTTDTSLVALPEIRATNQGTYLMQMSGPGISTSLDITDEDDLSIAMALLEKIRRKLRTQNP